MIVWGGLQDYDGLNAGGIYDPATDTWRATSTTNAPTGRHYHTAVWTGSRMIVWGGYSGEPLNTGGVYDPETDTWTVTSLTNAPTGRYDHTAVWTGSKMIVWGGTVWGGTFPLTNTGGVYDPSTDTWAPMSLANAPMARWLHSAVWTGSKMIVWGGRIANTYEAYDGGAYDPPTDTWTPTSEGPGRYSHSTVWTGSRMIVWGGVPHGQPGGIYDPTTDAWAGTSTTNAPTARIAHTAVWTGSRMIVWGGSDGSASLSTGRVYDPATDTWATTSTTNAPPGRVNHGAVWTGSSMIVWGGSDDHYVSLSSGGVYANPAVVPPAPPPADFHTVTPCRLVDTRNPAGPTGGPALSPGATRIFPVTGGVCAIPSTATAVSVNLTVVEPAAQGHLVLYPGDAAGPPATSSLNFSPGVTRANNAIVPLATNGGTLNVKNGSAGSVHLVLDVNGYLQ